MLQIPPNKLHDLLINDGLVKPEVFAEAEREANRLNQPVADILIGKGVMPEEYYYNLLATFYRFDRANLGERPIDEQVLLLIPEELAREKRVIAFGREADGTVNLAMEDPTDLGTLQFLGSGLKVPLKPFLASRKDINRGLAYYGERLSGDFRKIIQDNIQASLRAGRKDDSEAAIDLPVVAITDTLISYAISLRASDIHIEILDDEVLVRFRIDGILREIIRMQKEVHSALVARLKLLAEMKLDEHHKPQDGRFRYKLGGDLVDVRVSAMPVAYGEKIEMRLLEARQKPLSMEELGILPETMDILRSNFTKTYGMLLVTGPTGSGKTTLLYAVMMVLNRPEVNIVTIEDPIEYEMKYINQTQVNPQAGITFANGLRSILRQDPNIIMVGEIRDEETAEISVHSALTGHLVLSTLHTNDSLGAIPRLIDMKIPSFLVAAVINAITAQRLVRRICLNCIVSYTPEQSYLEGIKKQIDAMRIQITYQMPKVLYKGKGCPACGGTGYQGRLGIFEVLSVTEPIRKYIVDPAFTMDGLRLIAKKQGFVSMFEDGLHKVERGLTTMEEVLRVIRE